MMFGDAEERGKLQPWLGQQVRDPELAEELRTTRGCWIIGDFWDETASLPGEVHATRLKKGTQVADLYLDA